MKKLRWERVLNVLVKTWEETCPSETSWHFRKNNIRCTFNWYSKTIKFYL